MAVFGAPLGNEDQAVRAWYAALRMQAQVTAYGDEAQRSLGLPLLIRVGLTSGEVVARSIGRDLSFTYTAVGQPVHRAARMDQMAKPATILATDQTVALVRGRVAARPLGPVPVRGLQAPVGVHEISGAVPIRSRLDAASAARPRSPLRGREPELVRLDRALDAMLAGTGQVVSGGGQSGPAPALRDDPRGQAVGGPGDARRHGRAGRDPAALRAGGVHLSPGVHGPLDRAPGLHPGAGGRARGAGHRSAAGRIARHRPRARPAQAARGGARGR